MQTNKFALILRWGLAVAFAVCSLNSHWARAQTTAQEQETTRAGSSDGGSAATPNGGPASDSANAAILQELERMRARIAELEARLSNQPPQAALHEAKSPENFAATSNVPLAVQPSAEQAAQTPTRTKPAKAEPFAFADWTWLNGNARTKESPMDTKFFTPEIRADVDYIVDFNHPQDDTIGGSSEVFRSNEVHVTQLGVGGDFHYDNVRARLMTQFGLYSQTTPRNDASPARGQWNLADAYRYVSEAYGGYHFNALHGINVDAGIFMSYIGLFS